jgi:hypothetical protein
MIVRSDRRRRLTRHLFQVLGFATVAGIALTGACGGNVVVDTSGPSGSGGTTTTTTTYTTYDGYPTDTGYSTGDVQSVGGVGGSSGTGLCTPPVEPGEHAMTACIPSAACSESYTQELRTDLAQVLGVCDFDDDDCCNQAALDTIACGPTFAPGGGCCYVTTIYDNAPCPD